VINLREKNLAPVIKWSGSKRRLVPVLKPIITSIDFGVFFEPFIGGGSVLGALAPKRAVAGDLQPELVELWKLIQSEPSALAASYKKNWDLLKKNGHTHFYRVRNDFNQSRSPESFLFLTRTCVNGLIRFNSNGDFNNSLHHTRPGIDPATLEVILSEWSFRISGTKFQNSDYIETSKRAKKNDLVYLDPPYMGNKGRYQKQNFDFDRFGDYLHDLNSRGVFWVLSLDGTSGARDYTSGLASIRSLSKSSLTVAAGNSAFPKLLNGRTDAVSESVFMNFDFH
jgi:DNA adenine methylase